MTAAITISILFMFFLCVWVIEEFARKQDLTLLIVVIFLTHICSLAIITTIMENNNNKALIAKGLKEYRTNPQTGKTNLVWINEEWNKIEK